MLPHWYCPVYFSHQFCGPRLFPDGVGGGVRIHPENAGKSGFHGAQCVGKHILLGVQGAVLALVVAK